MIAFTDQTAANVVLTDPAKCCALRLPFHLLDIYLLWGDESWAGLLEAQVGLRHVMRSFYISQSQQASPGVEPPDIIELCTNQRLLFGCV